MSPDSWPDKLQLGLALLRGLEDDVSHARTSSPAVSLSFSGRNGGAEWGWDEDEGQEGRRDELTRGGGQEAER